MAVDVDAQVPQIQIQRHHDEGVGHLHVMAMRSIVNKLIN